MRGGVGDLHEDLKALRAFTLSGPSGYHHTSSSHGDGGAGIRGSWAHRSAGWLRSPGPSLRSGRGMTGLMRQGKPGTGKTRTHPSPPPPGRPVRACEPGQERRAGAICAGGRRRRRRCRRQPGRRPVFSPPWVSCVPCWIVSGLWPWCAPSHEAHPADAHAPVIRLIAGFGYGALLERRQSLLRARLRAYLCPGSGRAGFIPTGDTHSPRLHSRACTTPDTHDTPITLISSVFILQGKTSNCLNMSELIQNRLNRHNLLISNVIPLVWASHAGSLSVGPNPSPLHRRVL